MSTFILRFSEIALKGANRGRFASLLVKNIKKTVKGSRISRVQGRFYLRNDKLGEKRITALLRSVFGLSSFSPALECTPDMEEVKKTLLKAAERKRKDRDISTFRITTNRIEKKLQPSNEMDRVLGSYVIEKTGWKAQMKGMDLNLGVEVADRVYIYTEKIKGLGGLPVGIEGSVLLLAESEEALVAGFIMMKRGCYIFPLVFEENAGACRPIAEKIIEKLQYFSPEELSLHVHSKEEIPGIAEKYKLKGIAVPDRVEDMHPDFDVTTLRPVVAFPDKTMAHYRGRIKEIISDIRGNG